MSSAVINAVAKGIVIANDRSILAEHGGYLTLSDDWARKILYKMETTGKKMSRRMATTSKVPVAPGILKEVKLDYQRKIKQLQEWHTIPEELILNFDQTPLPYICSSNHTLHKKGDKTVPIVGKKRNRSLEPSLYLKLGIFSPSSLFAKEKQMVAFPKEFLFLKDLT